jgi:hypothetical protein
VSYHRALKGKQVFDVVGFDAVLALQMALMIPAMLAAMLYRSQEYSAPHSAHRHHGRWFAAAR